MLYSPVLNSFTHGEITPYLYRRVDLDQYYSAAKIIQNFAILPFGGLIRIPGTYYAAEVKTSSKTTVSIPFSFNVEQTYILEFGDQYIRFYKDDGQIMSGGSPYEISSPYAEADLNSLQFSQNADIMWITHQNYKPKKLTRTGHTSWTLTDYSPTGDPFVHNSWVASTAYSLDDYVIPTSANGYYYRCITAGTSGGSEPTWTTTINSTITDGGVTWRCESSDPVNYPACVTFFEQRLWFAATRAKPQTVFSTKSGNFDDMTTGSSDDDALQYTLGTNEVNVIRWIMGKKVLLIGTVGSVMTAGSDNATSPITPTNIMVHRAVNEGCYPALPVMVGGQIYYIHRDGKKIMQLAYDYASDSHHAVDASIMAEHLFTGGIKRMSFQRSPYGLLWIVLNTGDVAVLTLNNLQKVIAFSKKITDGDIESVSTISRGDGDYDEVWFIVKRTINGATKRYVEYLKSFSFGSIEDAFFVDCGLTYDGSAATTISGLSHLEGKSVSILTDGAVHPNKTVTSGQVTLNWSASKVHIGLGYTSILETLNLAVPDKFNPMFGRKRRVSRAIIDFYQTVGGKVGVGSNLDEIYFRDNSMDMDEAIPLFSGYKTVSIPGGGWDDDMSVKVEQTQPLPMCVRAVGVESLVEGR